MSDESSRAAGSASLGKLTPVPPQRVAELQARFPGAPSDFLGFLQKVGAGEIGARLMLYDGLVNPEEIYGAEVARSGILLFADDFQGYGFGFEPSVDWRVVEIGPNRKIRPVAATFDEFIWAFIDKAKTS